MAMRPPRRGETLRGSGGWCPCFLLGQALALEKDWQGWLLRRSSWFKWGTRGLGRGRDKGKS